MNDAIRHIVLTCCQAHSDTSEHAIDIEREDAAPLFGVDGSLDSIELVSLIVAVEQGLEDELGVLITLADAKAAAQQTSPFRSVGSLIAYAAARVESESGDA